jgi:hypothetical protein
VKNLQNDAWDDAYPSSATSALSPAHIGIDDLPHTVCKEIIGNYIVDHCSTTIVAINMVDTSFDS